MTLINLILFGFIVLCSILALHLTIKILRPQVITMSGYGCIKFNNCYWKIIRRYPKTDTVRIISTAGKENNKIILWLMARGTIWNWIFKILYLAVIGLLLFTTWIYFTLIFYCIQSIMWFLIAVNNWKSYKRIFHGCEK